MVFSFSTSAQGGSEKCNSHVSAIVALWLLEILRLIWLAGRLDNRDCVLSCQSVKHVPVMGSRPVRCCGDFSTNFEFTLG
jgi:hypothetical protein